MKHLTDKQHREIRKLIDGGFGDAPIVAAFPLNDADAVRRAIAAERALKARG